MITTTIATSSFPILLRQDSISAKACLSLRRQHDGSNSSCPDETCLLGARQPPPQHHRALLKPVSWERDNHHPQHRALLKPVSLLCRQHDHQGLPDETTHDDTSPSSKSTPSQPVMNTVNHRTPPGPTSPTLSTPSHHSVVRQVLPIVSDSRTSPTPKTSTEATTTLVSCPTALTRSPFQLRNQTTHVNVQSSSLTTRAWKFKQYPQRQQGTIYVFEQCSSNIDTYTTAPATNIIKMIL